MSSSKYLPKNALILAVILILISPIFGVILADMVGFHEPLDVAAEELHLPDWTENFNWTPFLDYTIPGLSVEMGYIIAGFFGFAIILGIGLVLKKLLK